MTQVATKKIFCRYFDTVTVEQLCEMLHMGKNTAYKLLRSGEIKSVRVGGKYVIATKWVVEYIYDNCL